MTPKFNTWVGNDGNRHYTLRLHDVKILSTLCSDGLNTVSLIDVSKEDIIQFIESIHLEWARAQALVSEQEAKV